MFSGWQQRVVVHCGEISSSADFYAILLLLQVIYSEAFRVEQTALYNSLNNA